MNKPNGVKCPHCNSTNTREIGAELTHIWDDEVNKMWDAKENKSIHSSTDNVIYTCYSDDCRKYFKSMLVMEVAVKEVYTRLNVRSLISYDDMVTHVEINGEEIANMWATNKVENIDIADFSGLGRGLKAIVDFATASKPVV